MAAPGIPIPCNGWLTTRALEGRAVHNKALKSQPSGDRYVGLTYWTPNINIFRIPAGEEDRKPMVKIPSPEVRRRLLYADRR